MSCDRRCFDPNDKHFNHEDCAACPGRDDGPRPRVCSLGVGCEETGVCYADAHGAPEQCGRPEQ